MTQINQLGRVLLAWHRQDEASQRLASIPGVGIITATALVATLTNPTHFRSGREFAAFLGLVPRQNVSGGKERLSCLVAERCWDTARLAIEEHAWRFEASRRVATVRRAR